MAKVIVLEPVVMELDGPVCFAGVGDFGYRQHTSPIRTLKVKRGGEVRTLHYLIKHPELDNAFEALFRQMGRPRKPR